MCLQRWAMMRLCSGSFQDEQHAPPICVCASLSVSQRLGFTAVILVQYNFSTHLGSPFHSRFLTLYCIMASKRVLGNALRCSEKFVTASSVRSSRCFSSQSSNWASASTTHARRTFAAGSPRIIYAATASRRAFSSSPASRHGHLDKPNAGEEYVQRLIQVCASLTILVDST